jgi:uncharacterized glyoxalase superfamily protein PhnB
MRKKRVVSVTAFWTRAIFFMAWWYCVAMLHNRSVPVDTVLPHIFYRNLDEAIDWLAKAFGFVEHFRYGDPVAGAQLHLGEAWIMVSTVRPGRSTPIEAGCRTQSLTIFVEDVESRFERARAAGVKVIEELNETVYGELQFVVEDPEGHHWLFSRHARDLSPADWGAKVANPKIANP